MKLKKLELPFNVSLTILISSGLIISQPQIATAQTDLGGSIEINSEQIEQTVADEVGGLISSTPIPDFISDLFTDISGIVGEIQTFLREIGGEVETGEIGLPDLEQAEILFTEDPELDPLSDLYGSQTGSTYANIDKLLEQYINDLSREYAENSALSMSGQEKITEEIDTALETTETSAELSFDSETQDVSQNILRNISGQLNQMQQLDYLAYFDSLEDKVARSLELELNSEALIEISRQATRNERAAFASNRDAFDSIYTITIPGERE